MKPSSNFELVEPFILPTSSKENDFYESISFHSPSGSEVSMAPFSWALHPLDFTDNNHPRSSPYIGLTMSGNASNNVGNNVSNKVCGCTARSLRYHCACTDVILEKSLRDIVQLAKENTPTTIENYHSHVDDIPYRNSPECG